MSPWTPMLALSLLFVLTPVDVFAEKDNHGNEGAKMDRDIECETLVGPFDEVGHKNEVA